MNEITKHISLDLARNDSARITFAKQYDHLGRKILVSLTDSGRDYTVSSQAIATLNILRPDGESGNFRAEITADGKILLTLTAWMLEKCGEVCCTVALYFEGDVKISTPKFMIEVGEAIESENEIDESESVSVLTSLISDCSEIEAVESRRVRNENQRIENEQTRIGNETARKNHESTRMTNEDARKAEENKRQAQEDLRQTNDAKREQSIESFAHTLDEFREMLKESLASSFPVGAVYISFEDTAPASIFGGTWERLEDGRFLMSGAVSGNTGGAENHSHDVSGWAWISGEGDGWGSGNILWKERMFENGETNFMDRMMGATLPGYVTTETMYGTYVDGDTNNVSSIPPHITVHMWRRIA